MLRSSTKMTNFLFAGGPNSLRLRFSSLLWIVSCVILADDFALKHIIVESYWLGSRVRRKRLTAIVLPVPVPPMKTVGLPCLINRLSMCACLRFSVVVMMISLNGVSSYNSGLFSALLARSFQLVHTRSSILKLCTG
jgi:hypothetical protein